MKKSSTETSYRHTPHDDLTVLDSSKCSTRIVQYRNLGETMLELQIVSACDSFCCFNFVALLNGDVSL